MSENRRGQTNTDYTSVTFDEIKDRLIERAKTVYPDSYRDFNKTSFGSLMFDLVAMVGEQLNFYAQFIANEGYARYARTGVGLEENARRAGVSLSDVPPQGTVMLVCPIVVSDDQVTPDQNSGYTIMKGTLLTGPSGAVVETLEDITIDPLNDKRISTSFSEDGSRPLVYYTEKRVKAKAGEIKKFTVDCTNYSKFKQIEVPDPSCTEIIDCLDSAGNRFYEVGNLSINTITKEIRDKNADSGEIISRMIDVPAPRRFRVIEEFGRKKLEFGYGSEDTLKIKSQPASSQEQYLEKAGRRVVSDRVITPGKYLKSDKYGVAPQNTTLTISYRSNTGQNSNIPIGSIQSVLSSEILFDNEVALGETNVNFIRDNITCTNEEPFNGVVRFQSTKEIALACEAAIGAQGRAVTARDIAAMSYVMPPQFGKIRKSSIYRDTNGLRRNLNLYCISEDENQNLQAPSSLLKENLKNWISSVKMVTDSIDIYEAQILNLGLYLDLTFYNKEDINTGMSRVREHLFEEIKLSTPEIGQAFSIGEVERILNLMPLIARVNKVQVNVKNGTGYSQTRYDISPNIAPDGSMVYMPEDFIWEIKNSSDITGIIK